MPTRRATSLLPAPLMVCLSLLIATSAANAGEARGPAPAPGRPPSKSKCPLPSREFLGICLIDSHVTLTSTLVLPSDTTLVCTPGATIRPAVMGVVDDATTAADEYVLSQPDTGVFFTHATNVKIVGCDIGGFDFAVFAVNNKRVDDQPTGNAIIASKLSATANGYTQLESDDTLLLGNEIGTLSGWGLAVNILRNSDYNRVIGNTIRGTSQAREAHSPNGFPGQLPLSLLNLQVGNANPFGADGVVVASGAAPLFFNLVINGTLYQFPRDADPPNDNLIADNDFYLPGPIARAHRNGDSTLRETFTGNRIHTAATGHFGGTGGPNSSVLVTGVCVDPNNPNPSEPRLCAGNGDCFFPSFDKASKGTCVGQGSALADISEHDIHIQDNEFNVRNAGVQDNGSVAPIISGNHITGVGAATSNGILIGGRSLVDGIVTRNIVTGMGTALFLAKSSVSTSFGAQVSLNDFAGNTNTVGGSAGYSLSSELSVGGEGNYWGPSGFSLPAGSNIAGLVQDSHPYCAPVAQQRHLPDTCQ
jgi:hypothetical protein